MKKKELLKSLRNFQNWRKGANIGQPDPVEIGKTLDCAISVIEKANTDEVNKILTTKEIIEEMKITKGTMLLDGYEPEDSCIKIMDSLINKIEGK